MKTYTTSEAAADIGITRSRVLQLCLDGRLGYTLPRHGRAWQITEDEIAKYMLIGDLPSGRPAKKTD